MTRKEAIDKVYGMSGTKEQHEALEFLIPEVRELREFYERQQEDKRIRKELVEAFEALDIDSSWNGISVKSILAWLEDQKPVSNPKWTELTWEDINYLEDLMAKVHYEFRNGIGAESFGKEVLEKFREYKEDEYTDEKEQKGETERAPQGDVVVQLLSEKLNTNTSKSNGILTGRADQKPYEPKNWPADKENLSQGQKPELVRHSPITYTYNSNASRDERLQAALLALLGSDLIQVNDGGYFTKQDLIEWVKKKPSGLSEEDVKMIGRIRSVVNECASYNDALDVNGDYCEGDYAKLDAWLKSLPLNLKKKNDDVAKLCSNEWSKEDEENLEKVIWYIEKGCKLIFQKPDKLISWLKSLRPQPHWKPSEEQMKALNEIVNILAASPFLHQNDYLFNILNGLREELKKL